MSETAVLSSFFICPRIITQNAYRFFISLKKKEMSFYYRKRLDYRPFVAFSFIDQSESTLPGGVKVAPAAQPCSTMLDS